MQEPIAWYWTVLGILVFGAALYGAARWIRAEGKGPFAEWLRKAWPDKKAMK